MIGDDPASAAEPERGNLRQDFDLVGDARAEHVVERRDPVGGDNQQAIAEIKNVANFPVSIGLAARERGMQKRGSERQTSLLAKSLASYRGRPRLTTTTCSDAETIRHIPVAGGGIVETPPACVHTFVPFSF